MADKQGVQTCVWCGSPIRCSVCESECSGDVGSVVVPCDLWERAVSVVSAIRNSRKGSCGSIENVYCPGPMNRHGIDNLWNDIQRHNAVVEPRRDSDVGSDPLLGGF